MTRTVVERVPIELFNLAKQRSQTVGQARMQSYRDIATVAQRATGIISVPVPTMKQVAKPKKEHRRNDTFDFKM